MFEFLRTLESKERNHTSSSRYFEQVVAKIDQLFKNYKQEEKLFINGIQKVAKEVVIQTEKLGK